MNFKNILSLKSLITLGFVIAVVPLFLGVMYAAFAMRETATLGRTINYQVFEQTKTIRLVLQKTGDIERKARLFVLLSDPALRQPYELESYETTRAAFKQALNELLKLHVDNKIALLVNELAEKESLIYQQIIRAANESAPSLPVDEAFQALREASNTLSREFETHVDHQFNELSQQSETLEQGLFIKGGVLLGISIVFIALLLLVVARSMRQLDGAIRRLGAGDMAEPIVVEGPADLRYLGERLEWLRGHLQGLEVAKQQFMHNVAHEIDAPLTSLREAAQRLTDGIKDDDDDPRSPQEIAQGLCAHVDKLQTVAEELLRYSQINAQPERQLKTGVNLQALLETVLETFQAPLAAKSLSLKKLVRPVQINGVGEQLQSIMQQLLANAVKYSPVNGEIRVMLREAGAQMELEVEDEGPGIEADERDQVFEPFFRGKAAAIGDNAEGPGLGLAIVKEYVANHRGKVEIIDAREDHHGARIRVQIPLNGDD